MTNKHIILGGLSQNPVFFTRYRHQDRKVKVIFNDNTTIIMDMSDLSEESGIWTDLFEEQEDEGTEYTLNIDCNKQVFGICYDIIIHEKLPTITQENLLDVIKIACKHDLYHLLDFFNELIDEQPDKFDDITNDYIIHFLNIPEISKKLPYIYESLIRTRVPSGIELKNKNII
jgi:hypothetical protein